MAVTVKLPGADAIPDVAPARDPGVQATPNDFGAQIGASAANLGNAAVSLSAHLYNKTQDAQDQVYVQTHQVSMAPAIAQAQLDAQKAFPDGGPEYMADLNQRLQSANDGVTQGLAQRGLQPSKTAQARVDTQFAGMQADALVKGVVVANNQKVTALQTTLNDNVDALKSQVLSGSMSVDDALKGVEGNAASGKSLWGGAQLVDQKDKWQQGVIDAAIESKTKAGDLQGAQGLRDKYYGSVPKFGDSQAGGVARVANNLGIAPRDLAAVISYETGGRFDPTMMGGKGGNYQGLIQFGPEERAKYGVKPGQSFNDQLPAVENYLRDRGVKPGMGLAQIYSIVNAGSLDANGQPRWAASDGNGNIASHVQTIQREHYSSADAFLANGRASGSAPSVKVASADSSAVIPDATKPNADASGDTTDASSGDAAPVLPNATKALYWDHQFHAAGVDQKQADARRAAAIKTASDNRELEVFKDIHSDQPQLSGRDILNDTTLTKDAKEKLFNVKAATGGGEKADKTYGPGFTQLYQQVHAADNDPNRLTDPASLYAHVGPNGDLTVAGVDKLVTEIQGRKTPEGVAEGEMKQQFFKLAKAQISGSDEGLHLKDPKGDELYLKFMAQALPAYDAGRKAGKSATELLNPDSPSYIGKAIEGFKRPVDQWFSDTIGGSPTHKGEAPTAFDPKSVKSLDDLVSAYRAGKIPKAQADQLAIDRGWAVRKTSAQAAQVPVSQ
jgi:hypothetical protein